MDDETPEQPVRADHLTRFRNGMQRPANAGIKKGGKHKKTRLKEEAGDRINEELAKLCKLFVGKSAPEIMESMDYNPVIHAILIAKHMYMDPAIQQKYVEKLMNKRDADAKADTKVQQITRHEVVFITDQQPQPGQIIEATPIYPKPLPFIPTLDDDDN